MIMSYPVQEDIDEVASFSKPFCLTVHLSSANADEDASHRRIKLKNVLKQAKHDLSAAKARPEVIEDMLAPLQLLLDDELLLISEPEDIVLLLSPGQSHVFSLPGYKVPNSVELMNMFNLSHLQNFVDDNIPYTILTLSHNKVGLYDGDSFNISPVHLKDFPTNMKDELMIDECPQMLESHSVAPASQGRGSRAFHGQYNIHQTDKDMLLKFFRRIDARLRPYLRNKSQPLILGGVEYLLPIYKKANTSRLILTKHIKGNLEHATLPELRGKAYQALRQN